MNSFGEENLLDLAGDRYDDMHIGIHGFAHTMDATLTAMDPAWQKALVSVFRNARKARLLEHA